MPIKCVNIIMKIKNIIILSEILLSLFDWNLLIESLTELSCHMSVTATFSALIDVTPIIIISNPMSLTVKLIAIEIRVLPIRAVVATRLEQSLFGKLASFTLRRQAMARRSSKRLSTRCISPPLTIVAKQPFVIHWIVPEDDVTLLELTNALRSSQCVVMICQ